MAQIFLQARLTSLPQVGSLAIDILKDIKQEYLKNNKFELSHFVCMKLALYLPPFNNTLFMYLSKVF